jgi:hypothetical protein
VIPDTHGARHETPPFLLHSPSRRFSLDNAPAMELPRDALPLVLTACVAGADSGAGALQSLAAAAGVCRSWYFAARDKKHWQLLAFRLWPAAATFERAPTGGWRCFVRARTLAERRGVTSDSPQFEWMQEAGDLPLDRYRFFLDVFDADGGALVTSAQLRTPTACGHVVYPCDCGYGSDDERAFDAAVAASDGDGAVEVQQQRGVALPVPVASWPAKVRFRVLALRTADGSLAQVMHAAAVSRGVFNGDTKRFTVPPSADGAGQDADEDEDEGEDDGTRVAQASHHAHDPRYIDRSAAVQVVARGSVAILAVECERSVPHGGESFSSLIGQWTKMLPCLTWAAPQPARAPAFFEAAEGSGADGEMPPDTVQLLRRHLAALTPAELDAAAKTQSAWRDVMLRAGVPALAQHLDADAAASGISWRGLAAQVSEAQRRPSSWLNGDVDGLSNLTFLLEASCCVSDVAGARDNETVPGARRVLLYSGAFCVARQPSAQSPGEYEFAGGAENALVAAAPFRPIYATEQLPARLANALPVWASMDDACSWLDGAGAMRVTVYALRTSDGAVTQLSSERNEQLNIWDGDGDDDTTLGLTLMRFATCQDGLQRLAFTARYRDHLVALGMNIMLIWPAAPPQMPRSAQRASECPRAELRLYDEEGHGALGPVTLSPHGIDIMDVLHALAHADWQLPVA